MHYWGDEWFKKNGKDLYEAIDWIEKKLRKNSTLSAMTDE